MKIAKQISYLFLLTFGILTFSNKLAYAADSLFEIKSGIDILKESTTTFDKSRTITGVAAPNTNIDIAVYQKVDQSKDTYIKVYTYSLVVGPSGYFSQNIDLTVGENLIIISANKNNNSSSFSTIIKRKDSEIKSQLENIIILPVSRS